MSGKSFQSVLTSLPIKSGGLGPQDQLQLRPAAYVGGLGVSLHFFGGERGVCSPLSELGGSEETLETRWRPLLLVGGRTAEEPAEKTAEHRLHQGRQPVSPRQDGPVWGGG